MAQLSRLEEAQADLKRLLSLKPQVIVTPDNPEGLSMRRDSPKGAEYRAELDRVLLKYGGPKGFQDALADLGEPRKSETFEGARPRTRQRGGEEADPLSQARERLIGEIGTVEQQIDLSSKRLTRALGMAAKREKQKGTVIAGEAATTGITNQDIMAAMTGMVQARPGMFQRKFLDPAAEKAGRVATEAMAEFSKQFGEEPVTGLKVPGTFGPIVTGPTALGEGLMRGAGAVWMGGLAGFEQTMKELGASDTVAGQLTRDMAAGAEVTMIIAGGRPVLFPAVKEVGRRAVRKIAATKTFQRERQAIIEAKFKRARARALNRAMREARRKARHGTPEPEIRAMAVTIAERRLRDVEVRALHAEAIRAPDEIITGAPSLFRAAIPLGIQKRAIKVAQDILIARGIPPNSLTPQRVQQLVADLLNTDDGFSVRLFADIEAAGMKKDEFILAFLQEGTEAAKSLRARRDFWNTDPILTAFRERALLGDNDAAKVVADVLSPRGADGLRLTPGLVLTPGEVASGFLATASRLFRKLIISLPATATRNFIDSGGFRLLLTATNQAIDQTLRRIFTPGSPELEPIFSGFEIIGRVMEGLVRDSASAITRGAARASGGRISAIKPGRAKQVIDKLTTGFPEIKGRAFASLEADIALTGRTGIEGFIDKYLLWMNRTQEFIIRRAVLSTRLDVELKKVGSSLEEVVDTGRIPAGFDDALTLAIDDALKLTFALPPGGQRPLNRLFRRYGELIEETQVLPFMEPFPRFIFNATQLILENSATAGMRLFRAKSRAEIAEGNFSNWSREMTGTALFMTAFAIRQGEFPGITPGSRFDEVIGPDGNRVSMSPFATIIPFLFLADLAQRLDEGRVSANVDQFKEFRKGLLSSAPQAERAGSAVEAAYESLLEIDTTAKFQKLTEFVGESVGSGFLRPFELVKVFRGEYNDAVLIQRETRGQGVTAILLDVFGDTSGPERESPTRLGSVVAPRVTLPGELGTMSGPLFSQFGGAPIRPPRNDIEKELVFQGFTGRDLSAKTGDDKVNALVLRFSGPILEVAGGAIVTTDLYKSLPNPMKQELLRLVINLSREPALAMVKRIAPKNAKLRKIDKMPNRERNAITSQLDIILRSAGLDVRMSDLIDDLEAQGERELKDLGL